LPIDPDVAINLPFEVVQVYYRNPPKTGLLEVSLLGAQEMIET